MLSKKDIEELATGAVKRYSITRNLVSPQIQENDKTPDWDGELNLYENKKDIRKNEKRINARIIKYKTIQTITYFINGKQYCRYSLSFTTNRN